MSVPLTLLLCYADSLAETALCGIAKFGGGTYTAEGITKLCEGLKGSAVTSLECAAAPKVSCQRPLTHLCSLTPSPMPSQLGSQPALRPLL